MASQDIERVNVAAGAQPAAELAIEAPEKRRLRLPRLQTFTSLRHRDFRYLWLGTVFMTTANWIQQLTLGWLVYDLTGSALLLGFISGVRALPTLFAAPIAGVLTDRVNRRKLMMTTQSISFFTTFCMALIVLSGVVEVWHIFVFALVSGLSQTFSNPSRQSLVPNLVPKEDLMNAYALNSLGIQFTAVLGPAVGGFLIAWFGPGGNFLLQSCAYLGVLCMIFPMHIPPLKAKARSGSVASNMMEGLRYIRRNEIVLGLMMLGIVPSLLTFPLRSLMPLFAKDVLDVGADGLGLLLAATGAGAVIGAIIIASLGNFKHKGFLMMSGIILMGFTMLSFSLTTVFAMSIMILFVQGAGEICYRSMNNTILQSSLDDEVRGRVSSIYMLNQSLAPMGTVVAGALAAVISPSLSIAIMGVTTIVLALLAMLRFPKIRSVA